MQDGPEWFKLAISLSMLVALLFAAAFTGGLVERLIGRNLTGLLGRRAVPRSDHVVVVGLGQVGLRLCLLLREIGISVVAIDDQPDGENVGHARRAGLPVVIGRGADPSLLRRLSLEHALAVAAVTSDDLQNIRVALTARAEAPGVRIVLRAGSNAPAARRARSSGSGMSATSTGSARCTSPASRWARPPPTWWSTATRRTCATSDGGLEPCAVPGRRLRPVSAADAEGLQLRH